MERFHMHHCKPEEPNAQGDCTENIAKYFKQPTKQTISQGSKHGNVHKVEVRSSMMTLTEQNYRVQHEKMPENREEFTVDQDFHLAGTRVERDSFLFKTARVKLYAGI